MIKITHGTLIDYISQWFDRERGYRYHFSDLFIDDGSRHPEAVLAFRMCKVGVLWLIDNVPTHIHSEVTSEFMRLQMGITTNEEA